MSVVEQMSGELHAVALLRMRRVMKWSGILPAGNHLFAKLFCHLALGLVILVATYLRFSFNYDFTYDFMNDRFSRTIDLMDFVALMASHLLIVLELLWWNHGDEIQRDIQAIQLELKAHFGQQIDLQHVRRYCNAIYLSFFVRSVLFSALTFYNNKALTYYALYSELVLLVRFTEFTLYCTVIWALYLELVHVGSNLLEELQRTQYEMWPVRRLALEKLERMQRIHRMLWQTIRRIEQNFHLSLIIVLMKFFVDTSALPYWMYLNFVEHASLSIKFYCGIDEIIKLIEVITCCWVCSRCDLAYRKLRCLFYTVTTDRRNRQLNAALLRLCMQLGQEKFRFSAAGFVDVSNEMLGKFLFGMTSYIVICIQFSINLRTSSAMKRAENVTSIGPP
ncbi:hypothetical protein KR018_011524 [Drosophila ironensis]|nr:hypothetical protein KR018_011524 [Drosophila ironensis]